MRIVVIGAGGYLGGVVLDVLSSAGHETVGTFRESPGAAFRSEAGSAAKVLLDVTDADFSARIRALEPEVIVYCVSMNHLDSEDSVTDALAVNVAPLAELARAMATSNTSCPIIYLSTFQVYGPLIGGQTIDEQSPVRPRNTYAATHQFCEDLLRMFSETASLSSVSLRISNCFGPPAFGSSKSEWPVINDFCRSAVEDREIVMKSDGSAHRDFIFVDDLALVVERLCVAAPRLEGFQIFNFASGKSMSLGHAAETVKRLAGRLLGIDAALTKADTQDLAVTEVKPFTVSTRSLQEAIGEVEMQSFEEGVSINLSHFLAQKEKQRA